jgi:endonuclease-8
MPEGDSIFKAAQQLTPYLVGQRIERAASRWPSASFGLAGKTVLEVEPIGKNLWIPLDNNTALRIHLGMRGRFHFLPPGERWRGSMGQVSLLLETAVGTVVCTGAPTVERMPVKARHVHPALASLGPDILSDDFDVEQVIGRLPRSRGETVAEVLLDQQVSCGIGNIYKCETLFLERVFPFLSPAPLPADTWRALYGTARQLMLANLQPGPRETTDARISARYWVYDRGDRPCLKCGTPISYRITGRDLPRPTWWCPRCQAILMGRSGIGPTRNA